MLKTQLDSWRFSIEGFRIYNFVGFIVWMMVFFMPGKWTKLLASGAEKMFPPADFVIKKVPWVNIGQRGWWTGFASGLLLFVFWIIKLTLELLSIFLVSPGVTGSAENQHPPFAFVSQNSQSLTANHIRCFGKRGRKEKEKGVAVSQT